MSNVWICKYCGHENDADDEQYQFYSSDKCLKCGKIEAKPESEPDDSDDKPEPDKSNESDDKKPKPDKSDESDDKEPEPDKPDESDNDKPEPNKSDNSDDKEPDKPDPGDSDKPDGKKNNRFKLLWIGIIIASILLILIAICYFTDICNPNSEKKYTDQVKAFLKPDNNRKEGELTQTEMEALNNLARDLNIQDKADLLINQAKLEYLNEIKDYPFEKRCQIAGIMEIPDKLQGCSEILIEDYLKTGKFSEAKDLLNQLKDKAVSEKFKREMETAVNIDVRFQYMKDGQMPSTHYLLNTPELKNIVLTHKDNYRFYIKNQGNENLYVYIFQRDKHGKTERLFPNPEYSGAQNNPVEKDKEFQIPEGENKWLYLEELPSYPETIYVIASLWKAEDIDNLYSNLHKEITKDVREKLINEFIERLKLRSNSDIKSVFYQEFQFRHESVAP